MPRSLLKKARHWTQSFTEMGQRDTERCSVILCVFSVSLCVGFFSGLLVLLPCFLRRLGVWTQSKPPRHGLMAVMTVPGLQPFSAPPA